jgi:hypothetical protein
MLELIKCMRYSNLLAMRSESFVNNTHTFLEDTEIFSELGLMILTYSGWLTRGRNPKYSAQMRGDPVGIWKHDKHSDNVTNSLPNWSRVINQHFLHKYPVLLLPTYILHDQNTPKHRHIAKQTETILPLKARDEQPATRSYEISRRGCVSDTAEGLFCSFKWLYRIFIHFYSCFFSNNNFLIANFISRTRIKFLKLSLVLNVLNYTP